MLNLAWIIPLLPLLSFIILTAYAKKSNKFAPYVGIALTLISFLASIWALITLLQTSEPFSKIVTWYSIGTLELTVGYTINQLNALMLVIVSLVSLLIQIYSMSYMGNDDRISTYYAYLGLFTASMLGLVISPNLLQIYVFWELVGLGSFLLIGFYYYKESAKQAAKKAFVMTRIGDVGLLIGILLIFHQTKTFDLAAITQAAESGSLADPILTISAILIFIGAIGKSAQFPLHTWLPDAMEGPTPVSALIHAATMVAAGVYLVATLYPLFLASQAALLTIAIIGGITAFLAATIAITQSDIKRVLAYSTVSQLGFMMMALGTLGYTAAIFHLTTHAFFKALLFLAAGSVIHSVGTQNIDEMGSLRKKLPTTHAVFLVGALAISGVPLLSGFFSKDEILISIFANGNPLLFWLAVLTSFLTVLYMFRLYFKVFTAGSANQTKANVKESSKPMLYPMVILAVFSVLVGYLHTHWFGTFLGDWLIEGKNFTQPDSSGTEWIMLLSALISIVGIIAAYYAYGKNSQSQDNAKAKAQNSYQILQNGYYIDQFYELIFIKGARLIGQIITVVDKYVLGTIIGIITGTIESFNQIGSRLQNGQTQVYGLAVILGIIVVLALSLWSGGYF